MALTIRTTPEDETNLKAFMKISKIGTRSKAILYMIKYLPELMKDFENMKYENSALRGELQNIQNTILERQEYTNKVNQAQSKITKFAKKSFCPF